MTDQPYDHVRRIIATRDQRTAYSRLVAFGFSDEQAWALARAGMTVTFVPADTMLRTVVGGAVA